MSGSRDRQEPLADKALESEGDEREAGRSDMHQTQDRAHLEAELCQHIFAVSAGMVGVCLTVIGLLRVVISIRRADTIADDILAVNAILFLTACLSSYWALRTRNSRRMHSLERFADAVFIVAMVVMAFACLFITYAITAS
jgi:hypothetical protein